MFEKAPDQFLEVHLAETCYRKDGREVSRVAVLEHIHAFTALYDRFDTVERSELSLTTDEDGRKASVGFSIHYQALTGEKSRILKVRQRCNCKKGNSDIGISPLWKCRDFVFDLTITAASLPDYPVLPAVPDG